MLKSNYSHFRADLLNKTENERMGKIQRLIDKENRFRNTLQDRVIERTKKSLKEKQALIQLLNKDYKVDNFITMKSNFDMNRIETKHDARHYIIETRIFNSGFNTKSMRPEINRQIRKLDPCRKYRVFKRRLLEDNRSRNIEINRAIPDSAFDKMLKDKNNWTRYNKHVEREETGSLPKLDIKAHAEEPDREVVENDDIVNGDKQPSESEQAGVKYGSVQRERILEKRLPRRPADAFAMTMRTLGAVYFQSSSYKPPESEVAVKDEQNSLNQETTVL